MRKIGAALAALAAAAAVLVPAASSTAAESKTESAKVVVYFDALTCKYDNANHPNIRGNLSVRNDDGLWKATGTLDDDNGPHQWGWEMFHNGSRLYNGSFNGSFSWTEWFLNAAGEDSIRFHVWNAANTINCNAKVTP